MKYVVVCYSFEYQTFYFYEKKEKLHFRLILVSIQNVDADGSSVVFFLFCKCISFSWDFVEKGVIQKRLGGCGNKKFPDNKGSVLKRHHNSVCHHHHNNHHHCTFIKTRNFMWRTKGCMIIVCYAYVYTHSYYILTHVIKCIFIITVLCEHSS